jgi:hypothetical protein
MDRHIIQQGESIISLSKRYGIPADKIWDKPENRSLRERGRTPAILYPGDEVVIPEKESKEINAATEQRHRFRCEGRTRWLRVNFRRRGEGRAHEPYVAVVDGRDFRGNLDGEGKLEIRVPSDAREAVVFIGREGQEERYTLKVGHVDPLTETRGVQHRLKNLGFSCGEENHEIGPRTRAALRNFQEKHSLQVTGEIDEATRNRLREIYGS